jgi:hypothetical protein
MGLVVTLASPFAPFAFAQGNGRPKGPRTTAPGNSGNAGNTSTGGTGSTTPAPPATTGTSSAPAAGSTFTTVDTTGASTVPAASTFRQFGAWLDDTSAPTPGEGYTSIGVGHWRLDGLSQTNMPMVGAGVGVTDRLQVSATLPFYRLDYQGTTVRGMDDVYLSAKYTLLDPTLTVKEVGLSVSPVVEILSAGATGGRVHFALPVSVEVRRAPFRAYGSAGYFTRGSVFSGAALEWTSPRRLVFSGALTHSYSIKEDLTLDGLGTSRQRMDVNGTVSYPLAASAVGYVSVGRSLSDISQGGTRLALSGGMSLRFSQARARP